MNSDHLSLYFDMLSGKDIKKLERINYLKNLVKWAEQENENIRIDLRPISPCYTYELRVYGYGCYQGCKINVDVSEDTYEKIESAFNDLMERFEYQINKKMKKYDSLIDIVNSKLRLMGINDVWANSVSSTKESSIPDAVNISITIGDNKYSRPFSLTDSLDYIADVLIYIFNPYREPQYLEVNFKI